MKKIIKILNKAYYINVLKEKKTIFFINHAQSALKRQGINIKVKTINDYFSLAILDKSLRQKEAIEKQYELTRTKYFDVWEQLDYKQKIAFADKDLVSIRENSASFEFNDKTIRICFFDEVLNALYDHEIAVFELPQFYALMNKFDDKLVPNNYYGLLPYRHEFIKENYLFDYKDYLVVYDLELNQVYIIKDIVETLSFSLINTDELIELCIAYIDGDTNKFVSLLLDGTMVRDKHKKKIEKLVKKGKYEKV